VGGFACFLLLGGGACRFIPLPDLQKVASFACFDELPGFPGGVKKWYSFIVF
tara:strand:+ start:385 stop:540 length:156 start_codon:yes stop_codon:yes gene_type:complete